MFVCLHCHNVRDNDGALLLIREELEYGLVSIVVERGNHLKVSQTLGLALRR